MRERIFDPLDMQDTSFHVSPEKTRATIDDYFAFSRMMLNKGRHGREQILSLASAELMTSDQL